jgi:hypothetical protein
MSGTSVWEHEQSPGSVRASLPLRSRRADPALVEARFVDESGREQVMAWLQAGGEQALEERLPVRDFPVPRGRRIATV